MLLAVLAVALLAGGAWGISRALRPAPPAPFCTATDGGSTLTLTPEQARNVTTIAAVAARDGLPSHAVTVAVATALQESGLENLAYGDRDSLGLFQQRPSQGWGTPAQIQDPAYASAAFFGRLVQVSGWEDLPVTVAAQRVQRSALPEAYADWETSARLLARTLTGEVPGGFTCSGVAAADTATPLGPGADRELGTSSLSGTRGRRAGWTTASWVLARAGSARVDAVDFGGQRWTAASGRWTTVPGSRALDVHVLPAD